MSDYKERNENEIFTKVLKAGRRTYFFDVRATKADDYYITITESKKFTEEDGLSSNFVEGILLTKNAETAWQIAKIININGNRNN